MGGSRLTDKVTWCVIVGYRVYDKSTRESNHCKIVLGRLWVGVGLLPCLMPQVALYLGR